MRLSNPQPYLSLGLAAALVLASATRCRAQFAELSARVPDGANAIFVIDVDQIMRSQFATNQGWSTKQQAMYEAGFLMLLPEASQMLAATKLDFETMRPEWEVFLMNLNREPSMSQLAERYNGTLDKVGRNAVVVLPGESYFAQLGPRMIGFGEPASRQDVARWMRRIETGIAVGSLALSADGQAIRPAECPPDHGHRPGGRAECRGGEGQAGHVRVAGR